MKQISCDRCGQKADYAAISETKGIGGDWDLCEACWWDLLKFFDPKWKPPYHCTRPEHQPKAREERSKGFLFRRTLDDRCELCLVLPDESHRCAGCRRPRSTQHKEGCLYGTEGVRDEDIRVSHEHPIGMADAPFSRS